MCLFSARHPEVVDMETSPPPGVTAHSPSGRCSTPQRGHASEIPGPFVGWGFNPGSSCVCTSRDLQAHGKARSTEVWRGFGWDLCFRNVPTASPTKYFHLNPEAGISFPQCFVIFLIFVEI